MKTTVLVIGSNGQLGSVLVETLQEKFGVKNVVASDLNPKEDFNGIFEVLDAMDFNRIEEVVKKYKVTQIYHLAAILSAKGEQNPLKTWEINMTTLFNVLEVARLNGIDKLFFPSSIAVFGEGANRDLTPNNSVLDPATVYGMSKAAGENWAQYYFLRYGLDVRSLRYPGVIGYQSLPGGGTTDYAVDIFHKAVLNEKFNCFLQKDATLPMIYMDDVIRATIELMDAPKENIKSRTAYNLAGCSFSPEEIAAEITKYYSNFSIEYNPDFRQQIAEKWPMAIDDSQARADWGWKPEYDLQKMTQVMLKALEAHYHLI